MSNSYPSVKNRAIGPGRRIPVKKTNEPKSKMLKKDWIDEINAMLPITVSGLNKCTIATLKELYEALKYDV